MKVAILCCGQFRSFLECRQSIEKHLLSKNNCTLFLYTSDTVASNKSVKLWSNKSYLTPKTDLQKLYDTSLSEFTSLIKKYSCDEIKDLEEYKDRILIEPQSPVENPDWWNTKLGSYAAVFYNNKGKQQVYNLMLNYQKKYNTKYDYILFMRPDHIFYEDINLEEEIKKLPELQIEEPLHTNGFIINYSPISQLNDPNTTIKISHFKRDYCSETLNWGKYEVYQKIMPNFMHDYEEKIIKIFQNIPNINYEAMMNLNLFVNNISHYLLYRDYDIKRMVRDPLKFSNFLRIRAKKTSLKIQILNFIDLPTCLFSFVLFNYQISIQIFRDKYVYITNWKEKVRR